MPGSFSDYLATLHPGDLIREGTPQFDTYRAMALSDAEQSLFLAASNYRRCLDLMTPAAAPWACVTAYYGAWHAAVALLHMFGSAVGTKTVVEADRAAAGNQRLRVKKIGSGSGMEPSSHSGSHRRFWDRFYDSIAPVRPLIEPRLRFAISPVSADVTWLIDTRNRVNYHSVDGFKVCQDFETSFDAALFPGSLPGALSTLYRVQEALIEISFDFADRLGLEPARINATWGRATLRQHVAQQIYNAKPPGLVRRSRKSSVAAGR